MPFLFPLSYLYLHSITHLAMEGRDILIQKIPNQLTWKVSTPIFEGRGEFPQEAQDCLQLIQQLRWDTPGLLEIDAVVGTIHWTQEIDPADFGREFPRFIKHAQEWEEVLAEHLMSRTTNS